MTVKCTKYDSFMTMVSTPISSDETLYNRLLRLFFFGGVLCRVVTHHPRLLYICLTIQTVIRDLHQDACSFIIHFSGTIIDSIKVWIFGFICTKSLHLTLILS